VLTLSFPGPSWMVAIQRGKQQDKLSSARKQLTAKLYVVLLVISTINTEKFFFLSLVSSMIQDTHRIYKLSEEDAKTSIPYEVAQLKTD